MAATLRGRPTEGDVVLDLDHEQPRDLSGQTGEMGPNPLDLVLELYDACLEQFGHALGPQRRYQRQRRLEAWCRWSRNLA
jgi:hypothetical protein